MSPHLVPAIASLGLAASTLFALHSVQPRKDAPASSPSPASAPSAPAPAPPDQPPAKGIPEEARRVLDRAIRAYRQHPTYQDELEQTFELKAKTRSGEDADQTSDQRARFWFERPGRFRLEDDNSTIVSDGRIVWHALSSLGQYTENPAPDWRQLAEGDETDGDAGAVFQHPVASLLLRDPAGADDYFRTKVAIVSVVSEPLDGEPGTRLTCTTRDARLNDETITLSFWFSDRTGLLGQSVADMTEAYRVMMAPMADMHADDEDDENAFAAAIPARIQSAVWMTRIRNARLGEPIPAERFTFTPDASDRKVDQFEHGGDGENAQDALVGSPAPAISAQAIDGSAFSLADLKGRVVVLDFWATWCGPCVAAIPSIQALADRFADKPVTVVGINQDRGDAEKVRRFLEKKKITFLQVTDPKGRVGRDYRVAGIPCTVIIDKEGVIRDIHVGGSPDLGDELAETVEEVLKGEQIVSRRGAAAGDHGEDEDMDDGHAGAGAAAAGDRTPALEPLHPERLADGGPFRQAQGGFMAHAVDLDGTGRASLVVPTPGRLVVLTPDGAGARIIRLKGASSLSPTGVSVATLAGRRGLLLSGVGYRGMGVASTAKVFFVDPDGDTIWDYTADLPKNGSASVFAAAGDLLGDGRGAVAVAIGIMRMSGPNRYTSERSTSVIVLLDANGTVVCRREVRDYIYGAWAAEPPSPGRPATILVATGRGVRRFTFNPVATPDALAPASVEPVADR
jgi:peroxiredoxin